MLTKEQADIIFDGMIKEITTAHTNLACFAGIYRDINEDDVVDFINLVYRQVIDTLPTEQKVLSKPDNNIYCRDCIHWGEPTKLVNNVGIAVCDELSDEEVGFYKRTSSNAYCAWAEPKF